jgi:hypothetical protein
MKSRRAISIVELTVFMTAASVILTMSAALVHQAMRTHSESRAFYDAQRSALRLARQLRRDAYEATAASVDGENLDDNVVLRLQMAGRRTVEYSHDGGQVLRILSQPGGAAKRDEFAFPSPVDLVVRGEDSPPRIVLTLTAKQVDPPRPRAMTVDLHVEASLNLNPPQGESP